MDVLIKYVDGSIKLYNDVDDVDYDIEYTTDDYIDIYTDSSDKLADIVSLDLNIIKQVDLIHKFPTGIDTENIYFHKSKKEVKTMSTENIKENTAPAAVEENEEDEDFDFAETFNRKGRLFTIDTEGMEGHKAGEIYKEIGDAPLIMKGCFINKDTGYGESVSIVTPNSVIYFTKANLEAAHNIRDNEKAVKKINEKGAFFRIVEFEAKKYKKKGYSFEFLKKSEIPEEFKGDEPCFKW